MLPLSEWKQFVKNGPLVSLDLIFYNQAGEVLVGLRTNRPAQNFWFVPGGRILKDETIEDGFRRITQAELAMPLDYSCARFLGVYQHLYADNFSGDSSFGTHYIVLAHEITLSTAANFSPGDGQHRNYRWMSPPDLIAAADVHPLTKNYFRAERQLVSNVGVAAYRPADE